MKQYKSRQIVEAEQYFTGKEIEGVKIGKNDPTNRWDDTPDGAYIQCDRFKEIVNEGDWVIKINGKLLSLSNEGFKKLYKPKKDIKETKRISISLLDELDKHLDTIRNYLRGEHAHEPNELQQKEDIALMAETLRLKHALKG